jgi:hypothetical protein
MDGSQHARITGFVVDDDDETSGVARTRVS